MLYIKDYGTLDRLVAEDPCSEMADSLKPLTGKKITVYTAGGNNPGYFAGILFEVSGNNIKLVIHENEPIEKQGENQIYRTVESIMIISIRQITAVKFQCV